MSVGTTAEQAPSAARTIVALVLFGLAFGYVEGAVVVDLRALYDPLHHKLRPDSLPGDLFPILRLDELRAEGTEHVHRLMVELAREGATLVMLGAVPWTFARTFRQWIAGFMIGFGVWDLAYYATLKLVLNWPESLLSWDLLFLLPVPWSGPVLAPVLVSVSIIGAGIVLLQREAIARPVLLEPGHWAAIVTGGSDRCPLLLLGRPIRGLGRIAWAVPLVDICLGRIAGVIDLRLGGQKSTNCAAKMLREIKLNRQERQEKLGRREKWVKVKEKSTKPKFHRVLI